MVQCNLLMEERKILVDNTLNNLGWPYYKIQIKFHRSIIKHFPANILRHTVIFKIHQLPS